MTGEPESDAAVCPSPGPLESDPEQALCKSRNRLDEAFEKLERLIDRTEGRLKATLARIDTVEAELNEMKLAKHSACSAVAELEGDMAERRGKRRGGRPVPSTLSTPPGVTRAAHARPRGSLDNLQRILSERGIQLGDDLLNRIARYRRKNIAGLGVGAPPKASAWTRSRRTLDYKLASGSSAASATSLS